MTGQPRPELTYERIMGRQTAYSILDGGRVIGIVRCSPRAKTWVAVSGLVTTPAEPTRREAVAALLGQLAQREAAGA